MRYEVIYNIGFTTIYIFLGKLFLTLNNKIKYEICQTHINLVGNQTTLRNLQTLCNNHPSFVKFKTYFAYIYIYIYIGMYVYNILKVWFMIDDIRSQLYVQKC